MERYILKYPNGKIRQQRGINETFHTLLSMGVISYIIDIENGEIMFGDKNENVVIERITKFNSSDLITTPKIK